MAENLSERTFGDLTIEELVQSARDEFSGLTKYLRQPVKNYTPQQQELVLDAYAGSIQARLILADEKIAELRQQVEEAESERENIISGVGRHTYEAALEEAIGDVCSCGASLSDGEGYDGKCGTCADRKANERNERAIAAGERHYADSFLAEEDR